MVQKLFLAFVVVTTLFAVAGVFWSQITSLFGNKQTVPEMTVQDLRQLQLNQPTNRVHTYNSSYRVPADYVVVW